MAKIIGNLKLGSAFEILKVWPKRALLTLLLLGVTGCATAPRPAAVRLAQTGEAATHSLQSTLAENSSGVAMAEQMEAFKITLDRCNNPNIECSVRAPNAQDDELRKLREEYAGYVDLRLQALGALQSAYAAMGQDAQTDARAEMEASIGNVVQTTNEYALLFGLSPISDVIGGITGQLAGLYAADSQAKRLKSANLVIGAATQKLAEALQKEAIAHKSVARDIEGIKADVRKRLIKSGLVSQENKIAPLADIVGVTLVDDSEKIIKSSPALQTAIRAMEAAQERAPVEPQPSPYDLGVQSLSAMSQAHNEYDALTDAELDRILVLVSELQRATDMLLVAE